jgi:hypothetical protein
MHPLYILVPCLCLLTLEAGLYIQYKEMEEHNHIFTTTSNVTINNGFTVTASISLSMFFLAMYCLFVLILHRHKKLTKDPQRNTAIYLLSAVIPCIPSQTAFSFNCYYGSPQCFETHSPLYPLSLVLLFSWWLLLFTCGIMWVVKRRMAHKENEQRIAQELQVVQQQ